MMLKDKIIEIMRNRIIQNWRKEIENKEFTIISQNCVGGVICHDLGLRFDSPTVNLFIEDDNFLKLVSNLKYYLSLDAIPLCDKFIDPINKEVQYPKISVGDIEICCLHYKNCDEAVDEWNKRKLRVHWDNIFVIGNSWNFHEDYNKVKTLLECQYKTIVFTYRDDIVNDSRCIRIPGSEFYLDERCMMRPNITDSIPGSPYKYFEKYFDFVKWLNG